MITDARPADLNEVHALLEAAGLSIEGVAEGIAGFLIAWEDGRVVAVAGLEDHGMVGLLRSVTVAADRRNRGLAGTLVRTLIDRSRARGHEALYLLTDTAQEYFARFGFARIERAAVRPALLGSQQFRSETCESSAVMVLEFAGRNGFDQHPSGEED
ncbi:MAG: GNAT family N-acetyltransferase [Armatimonadota bacterium]